MSAVAAWTPQGMGENRQLLELRVKLIDRYGGFTNIPDCLVEAWYERAEAVADEHLIVADTQEQWNGLFAEWSDNMEAD